MRAAGGGVTRLQRSDASGIHDGAAVGGDGSALEPIPQDLLRKYIVHARALKPSNKMVHAPQTPCSHPTCVPVSRNSWRRKSASVMRTETALE
mgnify:CR=1 FL=1